MKECHTRYKLVHHVAYLNKTCREYYSEHVSDCDPEEVSILEDIQTVNVRKLVKSGRHWNHHPLKPIRIPGPLHVIM